MKKRNAICAILIVAMTSSIAVSGCGKQEEEVVDNRVLVECTNPTTGNLILENEFIGSISPEDTVSVFPMVAGTVTSANFEVGDYVEAGTVLFTIDDSNAQLTLATAQLGLANAQLGKATAEQAAASTLGAEWQSNLLNQQQNLENLYNSIAQAKLNLSNTQNTIENYDDQKSSLESQKDTLENAIGDLNDKKSALTSLKSQFTTETVDLMDSRTSYTTYKVGDDGSALGSDPNKAYTVTAKSDLDAGTGDYQITIEPTSINGYTKQGLEESINSIQASIDSLNNSRSSLQTSIESMDSTITNAAQSVHSQRIALDTANDNLEFTRKQYELANTEKLENTKKSLALSQEQAEVGVDNAANSVKQAELALSYYTVTAPIGGTIEEKNIDVYDMAANGMSCYTISNKDTMTVTFHVSEDIMRTLSIGDSLTLDRNGVEYQAVISEVVTSVDAATGLFKIKGVVQGDTSALANGVTVKVKAATYKADNSILIPYDSVYYDNGQPYVYLYKDGRAVKTLIETGLFNETEMVVTSGLTLEDQVVSTWAPQLTDGVELKLAGTEALAEETTAETQSAE